MVQEKSRETETLHLILTAQKVKYTENDDEEPMEEDDDGGELKANDGVVEENHTSYNISDSDSDSDFGATKAKPKAAYVLSSL